MAVQHQQAPGALTPYQFSKQAPIAVIALSVVTFGIYGGLWFKSRVPQVNALNPSKPIPEQLPLAYLAAVGLNLVSAFAFPKIQGLLGLACFVLLQYQAFSIRAALQEAADRSGHTKLKLGSIGTFFLHVAYLQHHMNELSEAPKS